MWLPHCPVRSLGRCCYGILCTVFVPVHLVVFEGGGSCLGFSFGKVQDGLCFFSGEGSAGLCVCDLSGCSLTDWFYCD